MRVDPEQLLDEVPARVAAPELDLDHVWSRGRRRRRLRRAAVSGTAVGVTLLAIIGLGSALAGSGTQQPVVGDGPRPSSDATELHPVAVIEHEGQRITWRAGCPVPTQAVLLPGDPAPVDIDGDGDPDLPGAVSCTYPPMDTVEISADAPASELQQLRRQLVAQRADLLARLDALVEQPVEPGSYEERVRQQLAAEIEQHLQRLTWQIAEIDLRLRRAAESTGAERILAYEPPSSYTMEIEIACFCPAEQAGSFRVTVVDGQKSEVVRLSSHPSGPSAVDDHGSLIEVAPSIVELQQRLREVLEGGGDLVASSVADDGRPILIRLDPITQAVDDEVTYRINSWSVD